MQAKTVNIKADNCNISAETLVDGNCTVTKKLSAATIASKGGLSAGGSISTKGPVESEGVMIAYTSVYGNTKKAAELLGEKLKETDRRRGRAGRLYTLA